jgi:hypothetical protein
MVTTTMEKNIWKYPGEGSRTVSEKWRESIRGTSSASVQVLSRES